MQCLECKKHACQHYLTDFRQYDGEISPKKVEGCVFHLMYQELVNQNRRSAMIQSEMGATKHAAMFQGLAMLAESPEAKEELFRLVRKHAPAEFKALLEG